MATIAVGGFQHETNTFAPTKANLAAFKAGGAWPPLTSGPPLLETVKGMNLSIAGFIDQATAAGHQIVPTTWCAAAPSAHVTEHAFEHVAELIRAGLDTAPHIDAVYLCLHGAMVTEHLEDGEGELLSRVRRQVGPDVPIVASLDFHSNTTTAMIRAATGMVGYRTYPHVDMAETGRRTALLLESILRRDAPPKRAFRQIDYLVPLNWQCTTIEPAMGLFRLLETLEAEPGVHSLTFTPGFPAADIFDCGPAIFGYAETNDLAARAVDTLARAVADAEPDFAGTLYAPEEGVGEASRIALGASRPVVLADTQDNPGAGGDSNTTGMLRALVELDARNAAIGLMVDPDVALAAHQAGVGAEITVTMGGKSGLSGDDPFTATYRVEQLGDGRFDATGPMYAGARMDLGPMARLSLRDVSVIVASKKAQLADQSMLRHVGIEPTDKSILVVKSSVHFRADFEPIAETILVCVAAGPMIANPADLPWTRLRGQLRTSPLGIRFDGAR